MESTVILDLDCSFELEGFLIETLAKNNFQGTQQKMTSQIKMHKYFRKYFKMLSAVKANLSSPSYPSSFLNDSQNISVQGENTLFYKLVIKAKMF